jgi:fluoride ion exporter CrcB/FEX
MSSQPASPATPAAKAMTNGFGAAALLAAGFGSFMLAVVAIAADQSQAIKRMMIFYSPTGPLSGVTTTAIFAWLVVWIALERRWRNRNVAMKRVGTAALVLLLLSLLLTFPPIADIF